MVPRVSSQLRMGNGFGAAFHVGMLERGVAADLEAAVPVDHGDE